METPFDYLEAKINGLSLSSAYKIGFKAGEDKARREATIAMNHLVNNIAKKERLAGIKEVVERVESKSHRIATNMAGISLSKEDWESIKDRLKENDETKKERAYGILLIRLESLRSVEFSLWTTEGGMMEGDKTMNGKLEVKSHLICDKCSKLFWHEDGFLSPQLCDECRIYEPDPLDVAEEG